MAFGDITHRIDTDPHRLVIVVSNETWSAATGRVTVMPLHSSEQVSPGIGVDYNGEMYFIAFALHMSLPIAAIGIVQGTAVKEAAVAVSLVVGGMRP
jgi:hypothetical protein